jgi:hypothetical protein
MTKNEIIQIGVPGVRNKFEDWIKNRGGVQVWENVDLSNLNAGDMFTPALKTVQIPEENGGINAIPYPQPHWRVQRGEVITDITRFRFVKSWKEVKRFHVGVRMGDSGLRVKVTDGGTRKIRAACDKYPGSSYRFDYEFQEAVIEVPEFEA